MSHSKNGGISSNIVDFCPPGYFYDLQGNGKICYKKINMEFGLGINRDEDKFSKRICKDLYPLKYNPSETYDFKMHLQHGGYFDRCYDVKFTKEYSLSSGSLQLDKKISEEKVRYKDLACKSGDKSCFWKKDPDYTSCRSIKDCYRCSLSSQCVFYVETSTCVSTTEVEDIEDYSYLKIWKHRFAEHLGISTLTTIDLASLKIYNSCPKSKDLINTLTSVNEKVVLGAKFKFAPQNAKQGIVISKGSSHTLNFERNPTEKESQPKPLSSGEKVQIKTGTKSTIDKLKDATKKKFSTGNPKSYTMRLAFNQDMFKQSRPNYQYPLLILRLQNVKNHLYNPKSQIVYVYDFGKTRKKSLN